MAYNMGSERYRIMGKLHRTKRTVKPIRVGKRRIFEDEGDQLWVKVSNEWWKFPEEIEY